MSKRTTLEDVQQWPDSPMKRQIMAQLVPGHHTEGDKGQKPPKTIPTEPKMTKPERLHAAYLDRKKREGFVREYWFEEVRLKIGHRCWYLIDFIVLTTDWALEGHETKGNHIYEDSVIKFKAAADKYQWINFQMWQYDKNGGRRIR